MYDFDSLEEKQVNEYKNSKEWTALNNIWKNMSKKQQDENLDNFKIVSDLIKLHRTIEQSTDARDDYQYLDELSPETKQLVIDLVNSGEKNLYHSIMAMIGVKGGEFESTEQLWDYYSKRLGKTRPYICEFEPQVRELIELCWGRMKKRR